MVYTVADLKRPWVRGTLVNFLLRTFSTVFQNCLLTVVVVVTTVTVVVGVTEVIATEVLLLLLVVLLMSMATCSWNAKTVARGDL